MAALNVIHLDTSVGSDKRSGVSRGTLGRGRRRRRLPANLRAFALQVLRYTQYRNPPILHRKEAFLSADHPLRAKFSRLTRLEEAKGLDTDPARIGTRDGWAAVLAAKGLWLSGHRLVRR